MKNSFRIVLWVMFIGFVALYSLYQFEIIGKTTFSSGAFAIILNFINTAVAKYSYDYSYTKSNKIFMMFTLGGMFLRLIFLLVTILILLMFLNIDKYAFILIFFMFYFVLLIFEIIQYKTKVAKAVIDDER